MPDVLLGQSYYLRLDAKMWAAQQPYPPLGTLYAAAHLRSRGREVALFDAMLAASVDDWRTAVERARPRVAVIYEDSFNYLSKMCLSRMREAALAMIDICVAAGCPIVVSGSDATDHPEVYLRRGAAAVVIGEGEITLGELVDALLAEQPLDQVAGLALPDGASGVRRTAPRPFLSALDTLPFPAWDLVDLPRYRAVWRRRHGYHSMNLATTRGCPYHCNWCAKPIYGQRYAVRRPQAVVDEMAWIKRTFAPDHLWMVDDVFGLRPGWVEEFARLVTAADARIPFRCLMRADQVTPAVAAALAAAGCVMVWMGAESGSQQVLDAMEKGQRVEDIRAAARQLRAAGIAVGFFLQFGYPGEMWDDIAATLALVHDAAPDDIGVSVSYPLPGTRFYDRVRAELGGKRHWEDSADLALMYRGTYTPAFYRQLHRVTHLEFRSRRAFGRSAAAAWAGQRGPIRRLAASVAARALLPLARRRLRRLATTPIAPATAVPRLTRTAAALPTRQDEWRLREGGVRARGLGGTS